MPLALSQVRIDSLLGVSCPECEVRVDQGESPPPPHRRLRVFNTSVLGLSIGVEDNEGFDSDFPLSLTFSDTMPVWKSIPEVIWLTMYPEKCDLANHVPWKMLRLKSYNAQLIFQLQSFPYDPKYIDL